MSKGDKIIKDSITYTVAILISQLVGIFTSIAMRRFLTPEMMGIWTTFLLVVSFASFADFGIFNAVGIKIPYFRGKNISTEIQDMRNTAFTVAAAMSLIVILVFFLAAYITANRMPNIVILGIKMVALIIASTFFYNLYTVMLRADKEFFLLSKAVIVNSLAMLIFVATLTFFYKLKGIYFATFLAALISCIYIKFSTKYSFKMNFNLGLIFSLLKIGLPILAASLTYTALLSMDKIMIVKMLGAEELGFYSIATLVLTFACGFPTLFNIVLFPTIREEFGRSNSKEHILGYVKQSLFIIAYAFPVFLALMYFGMPILVHYVLPKYASGIISMKMLLCGCFFISLAPLMNDLIITLNRQIVLIPITLIAIILGMTVNYTVIKMGYGILGAAFGTSIAYLVYFAAMLFYVLGQSEVRINAYKYFFKICVPFMYCLAAIIMLENLIKINSLIINSLVQVLFFILVYLPVLIHLNNKTGIFSRLFRFRWKTEVFR